MMSVGSSHFSAGQAAKIAGLAYHQLNHWARLGVVTPSINTGAGYDGVRSYSFMDLVALKVVAELKSAGLALRQLQVVAEKLQTCKKAASLPYLVGAADGNVLACEEAGLLSALRSMDRKGMKWCLNIADIAAEVLAAAANTTRSTRGKGARAA